MSSGFTYWVFFNKSINQIQLTVPYYRELKSELKAWKSLKALNEDIIDFVIPLAWRLYWRWLDFKIVAIVTKKSIQICGVDTPVFCLLCKTKTLIQAHTSMSCVGKLRCAGIHVAFHDWRLVLNWKILNRMTGANICCVVVSILEETWWSVAFVWQRRIQQRSNNTKNQ